MKTKFILTTTAIDKLDPANYLDQIDNVQVFATETKARKAFKDFITRTNMDVFLLRVDEVEHGEGIL